MPSYEKYSADIGNQYMASVIPASAVRNSLIRRRLSQAQFLEYGFVALVCSLRIASGPTADLSYLLIAGYAMGGRSQAVKALGLSWLFTMMSPGIGAEASVGTIGRFLVIGMAALSVLLRSDLIRHGQKINKPVAATILLGFFFVIHSFLVSPYPAVSILKATSWTVAMSSLLGAWLGLDGNDRVKLSREIFGGLVLVMLFSLPLLGFPLGYLRNGTGFQGITNHPQAFGPTMAILGAWAASELVGNRRPPWPIVMLVPTCLVLVVLSEARTAGVALVLGVTIGVVTLPLMSGTRIAAMAPGLKSRRLAIVVAVGLVGSILLGPDIAGRVDNYLAKGTEAQGLVAAYDRSRGSLMDKMWANIKDHPIEGIGFGVASHPEAMVIERDPVIGLPVSASVEKGVMPMAVLEELGVVGWLAVAAWIFVLLRRAARTSLSCLVVASTVLFLNMGESTLFSSGGFGMLNLVVLAWAATGMTKRQESGS